MAAYPYNIQVTRNVKQAIVPVKDAEITVYTSGGDGAQRILYPDANESPGTEIAQPIKTDTDGKAAFFLSRGRIRVDIKLDEATTNSIEDVVVDNDNIILPIVGETPTGDLAGTTFTTAQSVLGERVAVYVDGVRWAKVANSTTPVGNQFNVNVNTLTFGVPPGYGAIVLVDYWPAG